MTREEAIEELERLLRHWDDLENDKRCFWGYDEEAVALALSALRPVSREQVEKVWRGEWVKRHKHRGGFRRVKGFDDMGEQHEVTIDERCEYDDLYCSKCGKQSPDNFLNFCGYCGAPMTDEAVEMVMERLEAMHNG
ncbi:MAG: zinc ribbon domain-containing protein [Oscillospiraceae bacterium]|nr:zinc ribbon domain-containing protein [Oscillospiraceae bacterium]